MPPYRQRYYIPRYYYRQRRRRWRIPRRRARKAFRRRSYRRQRHRRYRKVKTKRFYKKKLKLTVQQFQPASIRKCKIIGTKCLLQGSPLRADHNYIQTIFSVVPPFWPGGGGWSLIVFKLESLYEDWQHLDNIWTQSNCNLPLVRYLGCSFKFFQSEETDYIVIWDRCWPMVDTPLTHADSSPYRMFHRKSKITIPSRKTQRNKKPYRKVFIKPPTQMQNKWYFQKDICRTPLVMLTTTAVSLTNPFCDPKAKSNNITLTVLNDKLFQNPNFQKFPLTSGYSPKHYYDEDHDTVNMYLYATTSENLPHQIDKDTIKKLENLTPLTNTLNNQQGKTINATYTDTKQNWGNPFYHSNLDMDTHKWFLTDMTTIEAKTLFTTQSSTSKYHITEISGKPFLEVRYNPASDTGANNKAYLIDTASATSFDPPENQNLIIEGFPLYILLWGWTDFIKKIKEQVDIDNNYILVIQTDQFHTKNIQYFILIDPDFIEGFDPYTPTHIKDNPSTYTKDPYNNDHWFPKLLFQQQSINKICMSGPGCPRMTDNRYMQVNCKYKFYFKWGGCPKILEKACDPCLQSKWPTPDNILGRFEIQNPNTPPESEVYNFDWKGDYLTKDFIERIRLYTESNQPTIPLSESKSTAQAIKKPEKEETSQEAEEETRFIQLMQLRKLQQILQQQLLRQLSSP
nr:MAG: ORF1 [TTV-like mini virus]